MDTLVFIVAVIIGIVIDVFYHKLFKVTYFSGSAILKEFFVCFMIGLFIAGNIFGW